MRTFCKVTLVDESRDHVTVFQVEIIVGTKNVGGYDASEETPILLVIGPAKQCVYD